MVANARMVNINESVGLSCLNFQMSGLLRQYWDSDYSADFTDSGLTVFYNPFIRDRTHCPLVVTDLLVIAWNWSKYASGRLDALSPFR